MWDYHGNPVACPHQKSKKMCGQMAGKALKSGGHTAGK